ncbi:MAG: class I SAM-dependent methyltransferase [Candidatus Obscuribacterales bacterium]|nr:class I SAM-dependent methyltransferase [Candidatus Obscuribacterales bacterium]
MGGNKKALDVDETVRAWDGNADASFDFVISTMCLMDAPELKTIFEEAYRVIAIGGFFQFSINHPCFQTPVFRPQKDEFGQFEGMLVGQYFDNRCDI